MDRYIDATEKAVNEFYLDFIKKGNIVMLNLLKYKPKADYGNLEPINSQKEITGKEAYELYIDTIKEELVENKSHIIFKGECNNFLIGPESEKWDELLLVEHQSVRSFREFSQSTAYLNNVLYRTAGLEDSRVLPSTEPHLTHCKSE
ncbi:MAG: DUF1330 domain-containing protein [Maribacter sp.]